MSNLEQEAKQTQQTDPTPQTPPIHKEPSVADENIPTTVKQVGS